MKSLQTTRRTLLERMVAYVTQFRLTGSQAETAWEIIESVNKRSKA